MNECNASTPRGRGRTVRVSEYILKRILIDKNFVEMKKKKKSREESKKFQILFAQVKVLKYFFLLPYIFLSIYANSNSIFEFV